MGRTDVHTDNPTESPRAATADVGPATTAFASAADLSKALQRAAAAHAKHEERIGKADPDWPDWYAEYMVREQSGEALPS